MLYAMVPQELHEQLAPEFIQELLTRGGRIYAYRYRPEGGRIYGKPIDQYQGKCLAGKAFQVMIDNNLDFEVALYPTSWLLTVRLAACAKHGCSTD